MNNSLFTEYGFHTHKLHRVISELFKDYERMKFIEENKLEIHRSSIWEDKPWVIIKPGEDKTVYGTTLQDAIDVAISKWAGGEE